MSIWSGCTITEEYKVNKQSSELASTPNIDNDNTTPQTDDQKSNENAVKDDHTATQVQEKILTKKHGCTYYTKKWLKLTWQKKKIYLSIIPHLFDQATDYGIIVTYYAYLQDENHSVHEAVNVIYWYYLSIIILIIHRIVSSLAIWLLTQNWFNVFLQLLDLLMFRAIWTSYKLNRDEPSTSQRYLALLEATFEAMPQLLLSAVFVTKTGEFDIIIIISLISSLWSLTLRVSSDDKNLFEDKWKSIDFSYKHCPCVNFRYILRVFVRFVEISSRVCLLTLMWINLGGMGTGIIVGVEFVYLSALCCLCKGLGFMGNLMYIICDDGNWNTFCKCCGKDSSFYWECFVAYRLISSYIYLILVTCLANIEFEARKIDDYSQRNAVTMNKDSIGFSMFVYCWIGFFVWPCIMMCLLQYATRNSGITDQDTGRDFNNLRLDKDYIAIFELFEFGKKIGDYELRMCQRIIDDVEVKDAEVKQKLQVYIDKVQSGTE